MCGISWVLSYAVARDVAYVVVKRGTSQVSQKLCSSRHKQQMITLNPGGGALLYGTDRDARRKF